MSFKSYCWSIGTTSFRVEQLNYKNECQLRYLQELFDNNPDLQWGPELQEKYFDLMVSKGFIKDYPAIKDKDAREKTSGLADIGLVYRKDRRITPVGKRINEISLSGNFASKNIFGIPRDSYIYLLQFLKYQIDDKDIQIKPFVSLIYMLSKLDYLTKDEFTYLFPTCLDSNDVFETTEIIKNSRGKISINELLICKMMKMTNYQTAYDILVNSDIIDESVMEQIGLNRKSGKYDRPFAKVYNILNNLIINEKALNKEQKILNLKELQKAFDNINANQAKKWIKLFKLHKNTVFDDNYFRYFYNLQICKAKSIIEFKDCFFKTWHLMKWKLTLKDYYDLNKRYFNLTDVIRYENERFSLIEIAKYYFIDIIDAMLRKDLLPRKEYENIFTNLVDLSKIYPECSKTHDEIKKNIRTNYGADIVIDKLEDYLLDIRNKEFINLIDSKYKKATLLELIECFENRNDSRIKELITDDATPSTMFEYVLGIIWYEASDRQGRLEDYMNLSLDANFMPKSHAPGGDADLVFKYTRNDIYPSHDLLIEATLSESTGQRQMEWEPVSRHLETHIIKSSNRYDYVLFVASQLDERTLKSFRAMKNYEINDNFVGLKIIPIDLNAIRRIVEEGVKYNYIYYIFEEAYKSKNMSLKWYDEMILAKL